MWWWLACSDAPEEVEWKFTAIEIEAMDAINAVRSDLGLSELLPHTAIGIEARVHSENMLAGVTAFGHDGFDARADAIAVDLPWSTVGENVATSSGFPNPVETAVQGWIDSPPHYENIQGDWTHTGIGAANLDDTWYFTQIFLRDL